MSERGCGCGGECRPERVPVGISSTKGRMGRREFVATAGAAGTALAASSLGLQIVAGPFRRQAGDHFVPADKKLSREWVAALFARGQSTWYAGDDLRTNRFFTCRHAGIVKANAKLRAIYRYGGFS